MLDIAMNATDAAANITGPQGLARMELWRISAAVYGAVIIVFGTIGNMLSLRIFWNSDIFKESTHFLLIILQIADSCVLLLVVPRYWIQQAFQVDIRSVNYPVCLAHVTLTYSCADFAAWVLVFIVLDRFLAVNYPIRARLIMTKRNVVKILAALLVLLCVKNLPLLASHEWLPDRAAPVRCMYRSGFFKFYLVADGLLNFALPDSLLLIFNLAIFFSIRRHARLMFEGAKARARSSSAAPATTTSGSGGGGQQAFTAAGRKRSQDNRQRQMSVARVALVSGTIHLLTTTPSAAYLMSHNFVVYGETEGTFLVNNLLQMLAYTNNAINFLIYLPIDGRFRTSFNQMVTPECSGVNGLASRRPTGQQSLLPLAPAVGELLELELHHNQQQQQEEQQDSDNPVQTADSKADIVEAQS